MPIYDGYTPKVIPVQPPTVAELWRKAKDLRQQAADLLDEAADIEARIQEELDNPLFTDVSELGTHVIISGGEVLELSNNG